MMSILFGSNCTIVLYFVLDEFDNNQYFRKEIELFPKGTILWHATSYSIHKHQEIYRGSYFIQKWHMYNVYFEESSNLTQVLVSFHLLLSFFLVEAIFNSFIYMLTTFIIYLLYIY